MSTLLRNVEWVALSVNVLILAVVCSQRPLQPGKVLYWMGATILVFGVIKMKG